MPPTAPLGDRSPTDKKSDEKPGAARFSNAPAALPAAVLACISYITTSTALTLANKHIFSSNELNYPWMLLATQSAIVVVLLQLFLLFNRRPPFIFALFKQMLFPCFLFTFYIFSNSQALRHVSLPILSVIKSLAPMGIALSERAIFGDRITMGTASAMLLIIVGNVVTMLNDLEFSKDGYSWAIANVIINIVYVLSLRVCLSNVFTPIEKAVHSNLIAFTIMVALAVANGQVAPFLKGFAAASVQFRAVFFLSCMLCAAIGASIFWLVQTTSGSTLSFVGACNKFVVVILGGILFKVNITPVGWISVFFGVIAGVVFAVAKAKGAQKERAPDPAEDELAPGTVVDIDEYDAGDDEDHVMSSLISEDDRHIKSVHRSGRG